MSGISTSDRKMLCDLGVTQIFDLRANDERAESPTDWHRAAGAELWFRDHEFSAGALLNARLHNANDAVQARAAMIEVYQNLPFEQVESLSAFLSIVATGVGPIIYNCSAGKDRTGLATALLLEILNVDREYIIQDYLLSNEHVGRLITYMQKSPKYRSLMKHNIDKIMPLMRVERSYLEASFKSIESKFGTVVNYCETELRLGETQQNAIREALLEPHS
ncbi:hypothetical protein A8B75_17970 [Sphingomonadales bacterium EhC05]|nr:hypothetical protein A8B75_17970 [Sphingomonadales bacterium EhC05]